MKVELERVGDEPEKYRVRIAEDDAASSAGKVMGIVTRTGPTAWAFAPERGGGVVFDDSIALVLTAKDADELREVIGQRFGVLDLPADRLLDDTVEAFATNMLLPLNNLATHTHSIMGLIKALSRQVAVIAVHDIHESKREEFFVAFDAQLREEAAMLAADLARKRAAAQAMKAMLRETVDKLANPSADSDGITKH
jgi:hypothetical protein